MQQVENCKALKKSMRSVSQSHKAVGILYADLVGFTSFSARVDPYKVMVFLNELFQIFDGLCDQHSAYKLETIGDCYVCSVGVVTGEQVGNELDVSLLSSISIAGVDDDTLGVSQGNKPEGSSKTWMKSSQKNDSVARLASASNSTDLVNFAKAMLIGSRKVLKPELNTPATVRIGIHNGPCISGIVGTKNMKFCLFGDTVETAALMEKLGTPDCIHASEAVAASVPEEPWEKCKVLNQRGGQTLQTYVLRVT
jgi:class 3 adenylate cyclase